jgi:hypothetical protein
MVKSTNDRPKGKKKSVRRKKTFVDRYIPKGMVKPVAVTVSLTLNAQSLLQMLPHGDHGISLIPVPGLTDGLSSGTPHNSTASNIRSISGRMASGTVLALPGSATVKVELV